jgi:vesicle-fusing ATPase
MLISTGIDEMAKFNYGGMFVDETCLEFSIKAGINSVKLKSSGQKIKNLFRDDFSFE